MYYKLLLPILASLLFFAGCDEDDNDSIITGDFIGIYDADVSGTVFSVIGPTGPINQPFTDSYVVTVLASPTGTDGQIVVRNIEDFNVDYTASVIGSSFTIDPNTNDMSGSGTLSTDKKTLTFEYKVAQVEATGTALKR